VAALDGVLGGAGRVLVAADRPLHARRGDRRRPAAEGIARASLQDAAYASWNELNQASLANPELNCPDTDAKLQKLLTTPDPKSATGGTFQDRYSAYGNLVITTSEQVLQMAPRDPYWRFRIAERIRCNAPAIRYLQRDGTYEKRYSCRLRHVIADVLRQPRPACDETQE
jgi:hypothetical protein